MTRHFSLMAFLSALLSVSACAATARDAEPSASEAHLAKEITQMDTKLFDSFNHCSDPAALEKHSTYLDEHLEFYHDKGGVSWTRKDYIDKTRANVCGVFRRDIVKGSLRIFPVAGYGAIEEGQHEFCYIESGTCFGVARFLIVWHETPNGWKATRIFSYGHQAKHRN